MRNPLLAAFLAILWCTLTFAEGERGERPGDVRRGAERTQIPDNVTVERDVQYVPNGGKAQSLDLYIPAQADKPLPLIVFIHGGGFSGGDKASCPAIFFVTSGYAVASLNYRLSGQALFPAQIQDCQAAIRWLRANAAKYHIDPQHIGVWGTSAGGHLVAMLGTAGGKKAFPCVGANEDQSDRVQAVCDWFGPTDFTRMDEQALPSGLKHNPANSPESKLIGGAVQENRDKAEAANPIHYVTKDNPPFLIMHGTMDPAVPIGQSELLADALKKAGVDVMFQKLPGAGHGGQAFSRETSRDLVAKFFDKHLKGADVKLEPLSDAAVAPAGEREVQPARGDRGEVAIRRERAENPPEAGRGDRRDGARGDRPAAARGDQPDGARGHRGDAPTMGGPFDQLTGLTDEQKTKLIEIRRKYEELMRKEREEMMEVLTPEQRQQFNDAVTRHHAGLEAQRREGGREAAPANPRGEDASRRDGLPLSREERREAAAVKVTAGIVKLDVPHVYIKLAERDEPVKVEADDKTVITIDGKPATFAELKVGQRVTVEHPTGTAARIDAHTEATPK